MSDPACTAPPRPAAGVHFFPLDEGGVLYCHAAQEIHALNPAAAFLWLCLEERGTATAVVREYARELGMGEEQSQLVVAELLDEWCARGWVEDARPGGCERAERPPLPPRARPPSRASAAASEALEPGERERRYQLLTTGFALRYPAGAIEQLVLPVLAHLESDGHDESTAPDVVLQIRPSPAGSFTLLQNGAPIDGIGPATPDEIAPIVKLHLRQLVMDRHAYFLQLHAAAVLGSAGCWLFPAQEGSGKTTLAAGLAASGFAYLSDEIALLENDSLCVRPVPLALTVKSGAVVPLSGLYPELPSLAVHAREDGKRVRYLPPPPAARAPDPAGGHAVRGLVFPRHAPDEPTQLVPLGRIEGLARLLAAAQSLPEWLDRERVERLVCWMRGLECYALSTRDLPGALEDLVPLLAGAPDD